MNRKQRRYEKKVRRFNRNPRREEDITAGCGCLLADPPAEGEEPVVCAQCNGMGFVVTGTRLVGRTQPQAVT